MTTIHSYITSARPRRPLASDLRSRAKARRGPEHDPHQDWCCSRLSPNLPGIEGQFDGSPSARPHRLALTDLTIAKYEVSVEAKAAVKAAAGGAAQGCSRVHRGSDRSPSDIGTCTLLDFRCY